MTRDMVQERLELPDREAQARAGMGIGGGNLHLRRQGPDW